ncbi:WXG100 family type VII secretion target [Rhodococcus sp. D2-41]|uniref:WXG100 family type VII secretion target n=1 Tax=Speluncibacter jeojiensis TaxID=2710754 RepID=A0A9X4REV0_9ACTN|nr:WXG100 family type VII secretion target [Rhodococcus sp. D2-41]MDG3010015.1 WXG100 family type VII secretion target [Rhodococcus sp. D2-41]MDG3016280.1 WXG100 family type VII secretion target [Corynebacteriales bacterium D3-21]
MGSPMMRATQSDMDIAARHVADVNQQVQGELKALQGKLEMLQGSWVGISATEFHNIMERYQADSMKLSQALESISENIKANGSKFQESVEEHARILRSAGGGLDGGPLNMN